MLNLTVKLLPICISRFGRPRQILKAFCARYSIPAWITRTNSAFSNPQLDANIIGLIWVSIYDKHVIKTFLLRQTFVDLDCDNICKWQTPKSKICHLLIIKGSIVFRSIPSLWIITQEYSWRKRKNVEQIKSGEL